MTINLEDATYSDLVALVQAAEVAGVDHLAPLQLEGSTLSLTVTTSGVTRLNLDRAGNAGSAHTQSRSASTASNTVGQIGDAAIRSVIDILTGKQEPPRQN
ncbi:hypothetical protein [Corynebacterium cystitidis]|uniref:hypothetical protein n=1 Tax=Corynebacterium cystitidis TaxID=35757 RepID=UPI00211F0F78|nr:hypothetical protein [Corynebacterium cystitidis]